MKEIIVSGIVTPLELGDAAQHFTTIKLIENLVPEPKRITFICPEVAYSKLIFNKLDSKLNLLDTKVIRHRLVRHIILRRAPSEYLNKDSIFQYKMDYDRINRIIYMTKKFKRCYFLYLTDKYLNLLSMKGLKFHAGILGGHTISADIYPYIINYETISHTVNGPIVTAPLSISKISLRYFFQNSSRLNNLLMLRSLRKSLQKVNFVYVRGKYSNKILRDLIDLKESWVLLWIHPFGLEVYFQILNQVEHLKNLL